MDTLPEKFTCAGKFAFNFSESRDPLESLGVLVAQIKNFCCKISSDMEIYLLIVIIHCWFFRIEWLEWIHFCVVCMRVLRRVSICRISALPNLEHFSFILVHFSFIQVSFYVMFYGPLHMSAHFFGFLIIWAAFLNCTFIPILLYKFLLLPHLFFKLLPYQTLLVF